jgi:exonuclease SbcD
MTVILGDPHVGGGTSIGKTGIGTALNSRIIDQLALLNWTLDQAVEHNSKDIIITGDIFEEPKPHPSLICAFIEWVQECKIRCVNVHAVMGNHDFLRTGNFYNSPLDILSQSEIDNFFFYKDINTIIIDSCAFTMMPFRDRKSFKSEKNSEALDMLKTSLQYEVASIPKTYTKVLIGHFAIEGSLPVGDEIDDIMNELFCPLDMFSDYDYVWMGHIHKPQVMQKSPRIAHIGSMDISNFGENDQDKYIIVFDSSSSSFQEVKLPTRQLNKLNINIPKDIKDTTQFVIDEIEKGSLSKDSIVRLEISLQSSDLGPVDRSRIEKFIYDKGIFNISSFSESKKFDILKKSDSLNEINTNLDPGEAIKAWAEHKYGQDERKSKFLEISLDLLSQLKNESKD